MPATFIEARAWQLVRLNNLADRNKDAVAAEYVSLLERPEDRDQDAADDALGYLYERTLEETGNEEFAAEYVSQLSDFIDMSWPEIHSIDIPTRGDLWSTGRALVSALAEQQAVMGLVGKDSLLTGAEMGSINKAAARRMSPAAKKKMSTKGGIRETVRQLANEEKTDAD